MPKSAHPKYKKSVFVVILLIAVASILYVLSRNSKPVSSTTNTITANFACDGGKSIVATFSGKIVDLDLSDGRKVVLDQAISADGARYANPDETFVFWNVGKTAFIEEGKDSKTTYQNCIQIK